MESAWGKRTNNGVGGGEKSKRTSLEGGTEGSWYEHFFSSDGMKGDRRLTEILLAGLENNFCLNQFKGKEDAVVVGQTGASHGIGKMTEVVLLLSVDGRRRGKERRVWKNDKSSEQRGRGGKKGHAGGL